MSTRRAAVTRKSGLFELSVEQDAGNIMPDEAALLRGIAVIFQECFELQETNDDADLQRFANQMLEGITAGESETALRQLAANAQFTLQGAVSDDRCREVVHHARRLVRDYLRGT
jgi:hypothetical protein